jgi:hypothetical protein
MAVSEGDHAALLGVWRLISAQVHYEDTGEVQDLHGPNPQGFAIYSPDGRMGVIITASGRKPPQDDAEAAALFRGISAYTGRFSVAENRITIEVDAAWHPAWENSRQTRFYELEGDRITFKTEMQDHPSHPGRQLQGIVVWTRDR